MNRSDLRSLALHRAVAEKLRRQPELWAKVYTNVERMTQSPHSGLARPWGLRWQQRLLAPRDEILEFIVADHPLAQQYRSSSPFAGVLTASERARVLAKTTNEARAA